MKNISLKQIITYILALILIVIYGICMFKCSPVHLAENEPVLQSEERHTEELQDNDNGHEDDLLREDIHYGYICLDSLKTLTEKLPEFNNKKNINENIFKRIVTINVKGYEHMFFGMDGGKQWWAEYTNELKKENISYDGSIGKLILPYEDKYVLMPYQILAELVNTIEKQKK